MLSQVKLSLARILQQLQRGHQMMLIPTDNLIEELENKPTGESVSTHKETEACYPNQSSLSYTSSQTSSRYRATETSTTSSGGLSAPDSLRFTTILNAKQSKVQQQQPLRQSGLSCDTSLPQKHHGKNDSVETKKKSKTTEHQRTVKDDIRPDNFIQSTHPIHFYMKNHPENSLELFEQVR